MFVSYRCLLSFSLGMLDIQDSVHIQATSNCALIKILKLIFSNLYNGTAMFRAFSSQCISNAVADAWNGNQRKCHKDENSGTLEYFFNFYPYTVFFNFLDMTEIVDFR